ncbi:MAG: hypothetical protein H7831_02515 [Magnetococcus sp. WYHC-3]
MRFKGTFMVVLALLLVAVLARTGFATPPEVERQIQSLQQQGKSCVRPGDWMRRNHMDYLIDKREHTVREGVRIPDESLVACRECHTQRETFCDQCHAFVGIKPDCFRCHNY